MNRPALLLSLATLLAALLLTLPSCSHSHADDNQPSTSTSQPMLNGLRTATYTVDDLEEAKAWYSDVLGKEPSFDEPFYVGFDVGRYELGLLPAEGEAPDGTSVVAYWGVDDIEQALDRLQEKDAALHEDVQDVGEGIRLATVQDPFGNVLGVIENPNFEAEN